MGSILAQYSYPPVILSLIISVPSIVLYVIEVVIMIVQNRNFNSPFFRLFIARSLCNFVNYFCTSLPARFGRVGWFRVFFETLPPKFLAFSSFFNHYTFHADNLSTAIILINRLTLILFPTIHKKAWKYLFYISLLVIFGTPLFFSAPMLGYDFHVRQQNDNWTFTFDFHREEGKQYFKPVTTAAFSGVLFCVISGVLNVLTVIFYRRNARQIDLRGNAWKQEQKIYRRQQKIESRLTVYAIITFMAQMCMAIMQIMVYLTTSDSFASDTWFLATINQSCWINDLCMIVLPSWCLLWASSKVKSSILRLLSLCGVSFFENSGKVEEFKLKDFMSKSNTITRSASNMVLESAEDDDFCCAMFRLFIARFIPNCFNYLLSSIPARLGRAGLFRGLIEARTQTFLSLSYFLGYYNFHANNFSTLFILLNRITLIAFPSYHKKVWKYLLPISILIMFIAPMGFTAPLALYNYYVRFENDSQAFSIDIRIEPGRSYLDVPYLATCAAVVFCVICGVLNFVNVILYRKNTRLMEVTQEGEKKPHELEPRFTLYVTIIFAAQFCMAVMQILQYVTSVLYPNPTLYASITNHYSWISDMCNLVLPAWCLLWASFKVRKPTVACFNTCNPLRKNKCKVERFNSLNENKPSKEINPVRMEMEHMASTCLEMPLRHTDAIYMATHEWHHANANIPGLIPSRIPERNST
ncbi:srg family chemoreceptor domain-containing protein [Ditylenchus destructor]|nr:srg family chemoreceptor domain-containing protein [Ditylenchus destructor]